MSARLKTVYRHYRIKRVVHGIAHITGGGLIDNPAPDLARRVCAIQLTQVVGRSPRSSPGFRSMGQIPDAEMFRVFNMGIGMTLIVADYYAEAITRYLRNEVNLPAWIIGEVTEGDRTVTWADPTA